MTTDQQTQKRMDEAFNDLGNARRLLDALLTWHALTDEERSALTDAVNRTDDAVDALARSRRDGTHFVSSMG